MRAVGLVLGVALVAVIPPAAPPARAVDLADGAGVGPGSEEIEGRIRAARESGAAGAALAALDDLRQLHPRHYAANSFDYLAGIAAAEAGDEAAATAAWRRLIDRGDALADRAALGLARRLERGHPARALALLAGFADRYRPTALEGEARLLEVSLLARNGNRLAAERLRGALSRSLRREADRRLLALAVERGWRGEARSRARSILRQRATDEAAYEAARILVQGDTRSLPHAERWSLARALYTHREFARAMVELEAISAAGGGEARGEALFLLGRAAMKAGDDAAASDAFARLQSVPGWRDKGAYHLGRVALLCGDVDLAITRFERVAELGRQSGLAGEALLKLVRIRSGLRDLDRARAEAARIQVAFGSGSAFSQAAAIEVAGAALALGDAAGALADLAAVRPADAAAARELAYWRGVALAANGQIDQARTELGAAVAGFELLSILARSRLAQLPGGDPAVVSALLERARGARAAGDAAAVAALALDALDLGASGGEERAALRLLHAAYRELPEFRVIDELVLGPTDPPLSEPLGAHAGHAARASLLRRLGFDREAAEELRTAGVRPGDLHGLYQVAELARRGSDARTAVLFAERLVRRLPRGFHPACLPPSVLALLYPDVYGVLLDRVAGGRGIDPDLVRAVMREESRFDPAALSPAGARGLMQFIPETARRVGAEIGLTGIEVESVHEPAVAIPLGAAYLAGLLRLFDGNEGAAVAAYNAGEEAAFDWLSRTGGRLPDEFFREIEYAETRTYVDRVLTTLTGYRVRRVLESADSTD
jgi:TolA-binding protein